MWCFVCCQSKPTNIEYFKAGMNQWLISLFRYFQLFPAFSHVLCIPVCGIIRKKVYNLIKCFSFCQECICATIGGVWFLCQFCICLLFMCDRLEVMCKAYYSLLGDPDISWCDYTQKLTKNSIFQVFSNFFKITQNFMSFFGDSIRVIVLSFNILVCVNLTKASQNCGFFERKTWQ